MNQLVEVNPRKSLLIIVLIDAETGGVGVEVGCSSKIFEVVGIDAEFEDVVGFFGAEGSLVSEGKEFFRGEDLLVLLEVFLELG